MSGKTPREQFRSADDARALNLMVRLGTIYAVDNVSIPPRAQIKSGELITDFIPLPEEIGANFRRWRPCRVGAQVVFACPSGDTRQAIVLAQFNTESIPQPETDETVDLILFDDGTQLRKDGTQLLIDSAVPVTIKASQITLDGEVTVKGGNFHKVGGAMDHDGQDVGKTHIHLIIIPQSGYPVTPPMPLAG